MYDICVGTCASVCMLCAICVCIHACVHSTVNCLLAGIPPALPRKSVWAFCSTGRGCVSQVLVIHKSEVRLIWVEVAPGEGSVGHFLK